MEKIVDISDLTLQKVISTTTVSTIKK